MTLNVKSLAAVSDIPGLEDNTIRLEIQKRDAEALDRFEQDVNDYRSGDKADATDDDLDDIRDFLNRH